MLSEVFTNVFKKQNKMYELNPRVMNKIKSVEYMIYLADDVRVDHLQALLTCLSQILSARQARNAQQQMLPKFANTCTLHVFNLQETHWFFAPSGLLPPYADGYLVRYPLQSKGIRIREASIKCRTN
jgi:hypothetical protein